MTDLNSIKREFVDWDRQHGYGLDDVDIKFLIAQAEKAERYEKALSDIFHHPKDSLSSYCEDYVELTKIAAKSLNI